MAPRGHPWTLYFRQEVPPQDDRFDLVKWWLNASEFRGLKELAAHALTALTFPITTCVAESSFHAMKGLLTPDRRFMANDTQMGYSYAMVNGDINKRFPEWALV